MSSMRLFLSFSFSALMLLEVYGFTDETDRQALLEFKSRVSEDKQVVLSSWNHSFPLCNWTGVTCGRKHKRVTGLSLRGMKLGGVISPFIGNLSFLISLDLYGNSLGGTIPHEVGNLFRLDYLDMSTNFLGGEIPVDLFNCSRLSDLELYENHFVGGVPSELGSLVKLEILYLDGNNLTGKLPASLGNLTSLIQVTFTLNKIEGSLPDIARLSRLVYLELSTTRLSGVFPPSIYNLSSLEYLNIFYNGFYGSLKPDFGNLLPNLKHIAMGRNNFTGPIPATLSNISNLLGLGMGRNKMIGSIPSSFGKLRYLHYLELQRNYLGSHSSGDLEFLNALTNCTELHTLLVGENRLGGHLPTSITNLSTNLRMLGLGKNFITGTIPYDIGSLTSLEELLLNENLLTGPLPSSIGTLFNLVAFNISFNRMSGEIPSSICNITRLEELVLSNNSFEGTIPPSLGQCKHMLYLKMGSNKLNGIIPQEIMKIQSLVHLDLSDNSLAGSLPNSIRQLENIVILSVAHNKLSGQLPQDLGICLSVENLYLQGNYFDGEIPNIRGLLGVKTLDFSDNNFSGSIPAYFANFSKLEYLNLSINNFEGKVPTEGIFQNATIVSVFGNKGLCGGIRELQLKPCFEIASPKDTKHSSLWKKVVIGLSVGVALLLLFFIASVSLRWFRKRKNNLQTDNPTPSALGGFHWKISYGEIRVATGGFSSSNLIGSGSFGIVFKAFLPTENKVVAVKVLKMQRRGAMKSFMAECESLKDIRHRNLVKLLTACSSIDSQGNEFRALIYEFMPNGSLDTWLHPEEVEKILRPSRTLTLFERLNIAIDVASVLDYLHVHCYEPIAHCDLKPSNVLLDDDLIAHLSDFGLARLILKFDKEYFFNQLSSASVRGTIGYAAPEYGMGGKPTIHGDVYSFGVLILEMFTGKRPTHELFGGNFTLHSYTKSALPERVLDVADESILHTGLRVGFPIAECMTVVLDVGLRCCEDSPSKRLEMSEAAKELISVRERFFKVRRTTRG